MSLKILRLVFILNVLFLCGCKEVLYNNLTEKECNEMLSVLLDANISAEKNIIKGKVYSLLVENSELSAAIKILKRYGLPENSFSNVEMIFPQDGLISSPVAEHARFMYAISQEISHTISMIDGVIDSRVHVVIPSLAVKSKRGAVTESTASVFIRHFPDFSLNGSIPQIKSLVSTSVEGLEYKNVNVVLFPAAISHTPSFQISENERILSEGNELFTPLNIWWATALAALVVTILGLIFYQRQRIRNTSTAKPKKDEIIAFDGVKAVE